MALEALFRTCTFFHDAVLRHRATSTDFNLPIAPEDYPAQLKRLCTLARRSSNVKLCFYGSNRVKAEEDKAWTETEPQVAHLLLSAMAQLGGQPLKNVKYVQFMWMELSAVVPSWLAVTFADVDHVHGWCTITNHSLEPVPAPPPAAPTASVAAAPAKSRAAAPAATPAVCERLTRLGFGFSSTAHVAAPPIARHLQQQLAALPSLCTLALGQSRWINGTLTEQHSTSVTRLQLFGATDNEVAPVLQRLPVQFPNLVELDAEHVIVGDDCVEALLSLRSLRKVNVSQFFLEASHVHRPCSWEQLDVWELRMASFARLPMEGIQRCEYSNVHPSTDAQVVARVCSALNRWGATSTVMDDSGSTLYDRDGVTVDGSDPAALVVTLRPLMEALPLPRRQKVDVALLDDATPEQVMQLGQQLPGCVNILCVSSSKWRRWRCCCPACPPQWRKCISSAAVSQRRRCWPCARRRCGPSPCTWV